MNRYQREVEGSAKPDASPASSVSTRPIILVVEDSDDDFFLLQRAFKKLDTQAEVIRFSAGAEIMNYLTAASRNCVAPALLLLDLKLPGMSGFDLLKWLRSDPVFKLLRVNVLSSSAEMTDIQRAFELGANAYTVKPMGLERYEQLVASLLKFWLDLCELPDRARPKGHGQV